MAQEARIRVEEDQTPQPVATDASRAAQPSSGSAARPGTPAPSSRKESDFPFAVSVSDVYEGPLDLLLDLIRKQDVNVAADFIYMADVLIHIKSKMLLPRNPAASSEEQDDPRAELVNRLIEHEKFKSAAQMLMQKQQIE